MAVAAARLGGWSTADPTAAELVQAISFALHTRFPNLNLVELGASAYKVIDAKKQVCLLSDTLLPYFFVWLTCCDFIVQVVAGILYDVILEFTPPGGACEVDHFQIGDRFGELGLLINEKLSNACTGWWIQCTRSFRLAAVSM